VTNWFSEKTLFAIGVIFFQSIAQIFLKIGVQKEHYVLLIPFNIWTLMGYVCVVLNFIFWIYYLKVENLTTATAAISFTYIVIPILAAVCLGERISMQMIGGFVLISAGVVLTQI
jgi:drug/metabolite transporter (DMT)-like permease